MSINIRKANRDDVVKIVELLAQDFLGKQREAYQDPLPERYYQAFEEIDADKNNFLVIVEQGDKVIGTLQLTITTYLTYQGGKRAQIEGVRIDESCRGMGLGKIMVEWAIAKANELGCHVVQLTTDKKRPEALAFYKKLGFVDSHEGLKMHLAGK